MTSNFNILINSYLPNSLVTFLAYKAMHANRILVHSCDLLFGGRDG